MSNAHANVEFLQTTTDSLFTGIETDTTSEILKYDASKLENKSSDETIVAIDDRTSILTT